MSSSITPSRQDRDAWRATPLQERWQLLHMAKTLLSTRKRWIEDRITLSYDGFGNAETSIISRMKRAQARLVLACEGAEDCGSRGAGRPDSA